MNTFSQQARAVPRTLLTRREAAESMGMSLRSWERHVQPHVRVVTSGQLVLVAPRELERWTKERERGVIPAGPKGSAMTMTTRRNG